MANEKYANKILEFRIKRKYEILLVSFLILLFGDLLFPDSFDAGPILVIQNVFASNILFYGKKKWRFPLFVLLLVLIVTEVFNILIGFERVGLIFTITYVVYFILISTEIFRQIFRSKEINIGMVAAVLCGFIILGIVGGSVFSVIEIIHSGSFRNIASGLAGIEDLLYFSFITILSVGYGDITPVTEIAKKAAMFFGLVGYFYGVVVIGIIIGKYISKSN